jgi:hypothetical protein
MTKVRGVTGGGILGNKVSNVKAAKAEPTAYKVEPGRTSTIGQSVYFHKGPLQTQGGYSNPVGPTPNTVCGVGAGRTVAKSGSQGHHGSSVSGVSRPGADRPIFPGFK